MDSTDKAFVLSMLCIVALVILLIMCALAPEIIRATKGGCG